MVGRKKPSVISLNRCVVKRCPSESVSHARHAGSSECLSKFATTHWPRGRAQTRVESGIHSTLEVASGGAIGALVTLSVFQLL